MGRPARARARQPVGCTRVRARCARQRHRRPPGVARLVLHARGARHRRATIRRARARRGVGRRLVRSAARGAGHPLLPRDRRARPRRRDRDRRARARARSNRDRHAASRAGAGDARACGRGCGRHRARRHIGGAGTCDARRRRDHWTSQWPASSVRTSRQPWGTPPRSRPWRRTHTATPRRSGSTHSGSWRCCSMPGSPSDRTTATPQRTHTVAHSISRATQASRTTPLSPCPDLLHAPSRAETCAAPKSSSGARSQRPRELVRSGPPPMRASSSAASSRRPATPRPPRSCTGTSSSGRARPRRHGPRESLFLALAEDPVAAAQPDWRNLGDGRAVTAAAVAPV